MADLEVRLLGRPQVLIDGAPVAPPRGAKAWGLLAYLSMSDRPRPRPELAELLFAEAEDPLGALRWSLAALRKVLGRSDELKGDSIQLGLADAVVDTRLLDHGDIVPTGELLAGLSFPDSPIFELWLAGERRRLAVLGASILREAVLASVARGEHAPAVEAATRLVMLDPLDQSHQALLIRALTLSGDAGAAREQFDRCCSLLRDELRTEPGPAVLAAVNLAATRPVGSSERPAGAEIDARITVALLSFLAGAVDHGIDLGRTAVAMADRGEDPLARATARVFLGGMLSIAVRGWDECSIVGMEALQLAHGEGLPFEEAMARGLLSGTELMRSNHPAAMRHARLGLGVSDDAGARALNLTFLAAAEADTGCRADAIAHALEAVELAESTADPLRILYASAYAGHALLLQDDPEGAQPHVERSVAASASGAMLVLQPWPMAMLAEIHARTGRLDEASEVGHRAHALAVTTDVAYQPALALRAMALVDAARGDDAAAMERLTEALAQARRTTGEGYRFHWPVAWVLETLAVVSARSDPAESRRWAEALRGDVAASGMAAFADRADRLLRS